MARRGWMHGLVAGLVLVTGACGGDDDGGGGGDAAEETTTTAPEPEILRILVTNDDGVAGVGIDALVTGLKTLQDVEVTVVAPADDRTGTSDQVTDPPPTAAGAALISGHEALAVDGFPADSVLHALAEVYTEPPHVVVSGINLGQNLGPVSFASGTVGAARTAAREGIPALAVSQGFGEPLDYGSGVEYALDWVEEHREALLAGEVGTDTIANLNVPTCPTGEVRGVVEVESAAADGRMFDAPDCASTATDPVTDVDGFLVGYAVLSEVALSPPPA